MIKYLHRRTSDAAVEHVAWKCGMTYLWSGLTADIRNERYLTGPADSNGTPLDDLLAALWRLCVLPRQAVIELSVCDAALEAVINAGASPVSACLIPLLKLKIFDALRFNHHTARTLKSHLILQLRHPVLPSETAVDLPLDVDVEALEDDTINAQLDPLYEVLSARITEGRVQLLAEFLEHCASAELPYDPVKTISVLGAFAPAASVHPIYQTRLATSMRALLRIARRRPALLKAVMNIEVFDVYAASAETEKSRAIGGWLRNQPWLDDPIARNTMVHFLTGYSVTLASTNTALNERVDSILDGLGYLHRDIIEDTVLDFSVLRFAS
jgi:hypothetical protein